MPTSDDRLEWLMQQLEAAGVAYTPYPPRIQGYHTPGWHWMYLPRGEHDAAMSAVLKEVQGLFVANEPEARRLDPARFVRHDAHVDLWLYCTRGCSQPPEEPFARMVWEYATRSKPGYPRLRA